MASLTSELVLRLVDQLTRPAGDAARSLEGVARAGKQLEGMRASQALDTLATSTERAAAAAAKLKTGSFAGWGDDFQKQVDKLRLSSKDLDEVRRSWERFQQSIRSGGKVQAGAYFPALDTWKQTTLANLKAVGNEYDRLYARIGREGMMALGLGGGGYTVQRVGRAAFRAGSKEQQQVGRDLMGGLTAEETARLQARALSASGKFPSVDATSMHQQLREAAMTMRSVDNAMLLGDTIAKGLVALSSLKGKDRALYESQKFFSALDVLGKNIEPETVRRYYDAYIKALGVEGKDMDMSEVFQLAKRSRASSAALSDRFLMLTAPGLMRDLGASETGSALATGLSSVIGGTKLPERVIEEQKRLGLRDDSGFRDRALFMSDPDVFAWTKLKPALQQAGVDLNDPVAVTEAVTKIFPTQRVADIFTKLITQETQYRGKHEQYERAPGLAAADKLRQTDPYVALEGVNAQLRNMFSILTDAPLKQGVELMNLFSGAISRVNAKLAENPDVAKTVGTAATGAAATMAAGGAMGALKGMAGGPGGAVLGGVKGAVRTWPLAAPGLAALDTLTPEARARAEKGIAELSTPEGRAAARERAQKDLSDWMPWLGGRPSARAAEAIRSKLLDYQLGSPLSPGYSRDSTFGSRGRFERDPSIMPPGFRHMSNYTSRNVAPTPAGQRPVNDLRELGFDVAAAPAGAAGKGTGIAFRQGLNEELDKALLDVSVRMQSIIGMMNFKAGPQISPTGGGRRSSTLDPAQAKRGGLNDFGSW